MAEQLPNINDLWAGWNNEQIKGDGIYIPQYKPLLYQSTATYGQGKPFQSIIKNSGLTAGALEKVLANAQMNQTVNNTTGATGASNTGGGGFDFQSFLSENKWLVIGGVVAIGYFLMNSGGNLAEKSVVTRYATRK
jgi:hypothetical protein